MPEERQGERTDMSKLYDLVKDGLSDFEIIDSNPRYIQQLDKIENVRQILRYEQFKNCFRELDVSYITGETGAGKTRSVMGEVRLSECTVSRIMIIRLIATRGRT